MSHQHRRIGRNIFAWPTETECLQHGTVKMFSRCILIWTIAGPIVGPLFLIGSVVSYLRPSSFKQRAQYRHSFNSWAAAKKEAKLLEERWRIDIRAKEPEPLPRTRTRALSLTARKPEQGDENELGLGLFSRLPPDIRILIWELTSGDQKIALYPGKRRILYHVLSVAESENENIDFSQGMPVDFASSIQQPQANLSALLKLSRVIYRETAPLLYNQNTFILYQNLTLSYLQLTTLPHRFTSIRHLAVHFQFRFLWTFSRDPRGELITPTSAPFDPSTWLQTCNILSTMTSLCTLFINIRGPFEANSQIIEVLDTISESEITCPKAGFKVRVPWPRVIARTKDDAIDRRFEHKQFPFEVMRLGDVKPDEWTGFEWAED